MIFRGLSLLAFLVLGLVGCSDPVAGSGWNFASNWVITSGVPGCPQ